MDALQCVFFLPGTECLDGAMFSASDTEQSVPLDNFMLALKCFLK